MTEELSRFPVDDRVGARPARRADAARNRSGLVAAARELFAEHGLDVPMAAVARRAGVGPATAYRHFPTKDALIVEVFRNGFAGCRAAVDRALAEPDPWLGFRIAIETLGELHLTDRGFTEAFLATYSDEVDFGSLRGPMLADMARIVRRAQDAGVLRADFETGDIGMILRAVHGLATGSPDRDRRATRRLLTYLIDAAHTGRGGRGASAGG